MDLRAILSAGEGVYLPDYIRGEAECAVCAGAQGDELLRGAGFKGYDAQYYAQIAMRPWLTNRALNEAMDSMPYRARRILFSWTAYGLGGGDPARALHIYAVQNIVCWFLLAGLLLRWFPATSWENFFAGAEYCFRSGCVSACAGRSWTGRVC